MSMARSLFIFLSITGFCWLLYLLAPVLTPFAIAALLAYLGDPLADKLETWKFSRTWATVTVFFTFSLLLSLILVLVVPLLEEQISVFFTKLPSYAQSIKQMIDPFLSQVMPDTELSIVNQLTKLIEQNWKEAGGLAASILASVSQSGVAIATWFMNLLLIPVVGFYLLRDWDILVENIHRLIPRRFEPAALKLTKESNDVLGAFIRGQAMVMFILGMVYSLGLWLVGVDLAFLIGMMAGVVSFVPYLGTIIGIFAGGLATYLQFHEATHLIFTLLVFGFGQLLEGMILTPLLVGDRIGLHPVAVIFAVLAGGQLFGFFGILIALPVAAIVAVLLRHGNELYQSSLLYDDHVKVHIEEQ